MTGTLDFYNANADAFIERTIHSDMSDLYEHFLRYLKPSGRVLDLGCGSGRDSAFFIKQGFSVVAVDGSEKLCRRVKELYGIDAVCKRFEDLDYKNEFDGVWACASLLHVKKQDMREVLRKVSASIKQNGILYVSYKYGVTEREDNGRHFSDYSENDLPSLVNEEDGLKLVEYWITADVRPDHHDEKWLNIIAHKDDDVTP